MSILHKLNVQHAIRHIFSVICKGFLKYFFFKCFYLLSLLLYIN